MQASDLLVKCLEAEGVERVFGVPGEENEDLLFSLDQSKQITFIPTRHEQEAAFMADVWGRLTGTAGVCLATLGPGATNLLTGLADADLDKAPVVAITGQGGIARLHKESHQVVDVVDMFKPIVKWNTQILTPEVIPEVVRKAFKLAQLEKPGVTHLELPEDVAGAAATGEPLEPHRIRRPAPDYKAIQQALELLRKAKYPVIIAGNGAIRKLASKHLRLFVEQTGIPVVSTFMGKGAVSDKDPHSLYTIGIMGRDYPMCALDRADLIITVGYDIAEYDPKKWNPDKKPIIHIDFDQAEVYEYYNPEVEVVADISGSLWQLNEALKEKRLRFDGWYAPVRDAMEADFATYALTDGAPFTVPGVLGELRSRMRDDDIIISDVGAHKMWLGRNFPVYEPGTCIISNGLAAMGIAVPGGVAATLAHPDRHVVAVTGDGGFLMNSQALETAKRIGSKYTVVLVNDNDYGLISWKQHARRGKITGTRIGNPDFKAYVESFGIKAYHPQTKAELDAALDQAIGKQELAVVAVDVDPSENIRLSERLDSDLCVNFKLPKSKR